MTTYYVDYLDGNDANTGLAEGSGFAFKTLTKAESVIAAGDHVYAKASAVYAETLTLTFNTTSLDSVIYEGYSTTPGDGGVATITPPSGDCVTSGGLTRNYRVFKNFRMTGGANGFNDSAGDQHLFVNCEFDNNTTRGALVDNGCVFVRCSFHDNGSNGVSADANPVFIHCVSYNNGQANFQSFAGSFYGCLSYNPPAVAGSALARAQGGGSFPSVLIANTFDGDNAASSDGIQFWNSNVCVAINNIIKDVDQVAIDTSGGAQFNSTFFDHNLLEGNTTNYNANFSAGANDVSGDPLFTDEAGRDYTLSNGSPAIDAGEGPRTA